MRIKVFKAVDLKEAMAMVKDELGSDAVILHTKRYREGGFLGYNSKEVVEVTAAVEDEPRQRPRQRATRNTRSKPQSAPMSLRPKTVVAQYKNANMPEEVPEAEQSPVHRQAAPVPRMRTPQVATYAEPGLLPQDQPAKKIPSVLAPVRPVRQPVIVEQPVQVQSVIPVESKPEDDAKIKQLEKELAEMKEILKQVMGNSGNPDFETLQDLLKKKEVGQELLEDMIKTMPGVGLAAESHSEDAHTALTNYLSNTLNFTGGISLKPGKPTIIALIGTTGVGKTTTLAKIAARCVLEKGVSAALITADTYRISAVEQLRTYSDIIGLPLDIVYSPLELKTAIRKHRSKQLILIDTAGRSQNNEFQMNELMEFLQVEPSIEKHLVLSATTRDRDIDGIMEKFSVCNPDRLIFTKIDEATCIGHILNLLFKKKIPLSYLTNGQSVPDDIVPAKPEMVTKFLLE